MSNRLQKILGWKLFLARLGLFWERLWLASFWPQMVVGIVLLAVFSGFAGWLLSDTSIMASLALAVTVLVFTAFSCRKLLAVRWPGQAEALRRIERRSNLKHRPVTAWHDDLADPEGDEQTKAIWQQHQQRQRAQFAKLKSGIPRSGWMYLDPWAWRFTLAMLLLVSVVLNGQNWRYELKRLSGHTPIRVADNITVDAWISPPAYTLKPPILLTSEAFKKAMAAGEDLIVPEGSKLKVRVNGVSDFSVVLSKGLEDGSPGQELQRVQAKAEPDAAFSESVVVLKRPLHVGVWFNGQQQSSWKVALIPDDAPKVDITGKIAVTPTGGFSVPWTVSDDYGVAALKGTLTRVRQSQTKRDGIDSNKGKPLSYEAPVFSASLPRLNPKSAKGKSFQDLTAHPWAGQKVRLVLTATDQAGQTGHSKEIVFRLPERQFRKPVAQILVEQRRRLVEAPDDKHQIVKTLAALMAWPQGLIKKSGNYLGLRIVATKLHQAKSRPQLKQQVKEMWKLALAIEDGDLSGAKAKLEAARRALQKALRDGADADTIAKLTNDLKKALNEYMEAMARQMQQSLSKNQQQPNGLQQNGREIRASDLQKMMDNIENLAKSGANDAAQEMLSQLENILKNLQPGVAQQPTAPQRTPPGARSLQELTDLMRKQQQLMDKTFKMPEQRNGQQQQGQQQPGKDGKQNPSNKMGNSLMTQQDQLKNLLGKMMDQMAKNGLPSPRSLEQAKRAMRDATRALKNGRKGQALGMQGNAMQGMRKGAEAMAKDLMQRGQGEEGNFGRHSESAANKNDPLGRPMPRNGEDFGRNENILPKESEIMRARDIMRALRRRSNDRQRPQIEQDYIKRLLDGLF